MISKYSVLLLVLYIYISLNKFRLSVYNLTCSEGIRKTIGKHKFFYNTLITPRSEWEDANYGWLANGVSYFNIYNTISSFDCCILILFVMDLLFVAAHFCGDGYVP